MHKISRKEKAFLFVSFDTLWSDGCNRQSVLQYNCKIQDSGASQTKNPSEHYTSEMYAVFHFTDHDGEHNKTGKNATHDRILLEDALHEQERMRNEPHHATQWLFLMD